MNETQNKNTYRLFGAFRLLLALIVVVSHSRALGGEIISQALLPWGIGNIGVMGFFILSGFIITEALEVFYKDRTKAFLANRILRLFPPYLAALLFSIAVHYFLTTYGTPKFFDYTETPHGIFSTHNFLSNTILPFISYGLGSIGLEPSYYFVRYVWAVAVEWMFYVLIAVFMLYWNRKAWGGIVAFVLVIMVALTYEIKGWMWIAPITFAPYFLVGVCLYYALTTRSLLAKFGVIVAFGLTFRHYYHYAGGTEEAIISALIVWGIALSLIPLSKIRASPRLRDMDRKLGDLSYPVYLNHYVITVLFLSITSARSWTVIVLCVLASLLASWALAGLVEPGTKGFRDRLRGASVG